MTLTTTGRFALVALAVLAAGCGSDAGHDEARIVDLDRVWQLEEMVVAGVAAEGALVIELDTVDAVLAGRSACHRVFGSFTLRRDGTASFTVPGRSTEPCDQADQEIQDRTIEVLERVSSWRLTDGHLDLRHPDGSRLLLAPAG